MVAIKRLAFDIIPQDPTRAEYRQGGTLGDDRKHWFRAKFFQQCRLFFRYHAASKIIVLAWVNDEASKVFKRILIHGHPPDDWDELLNEAAHRQ
nr:type II toxin-antitoxin system YhaV family toxin [Pseudomonas monteilii]